VRAALTYARGHPPIRNLMLLQAFAVLFFTISVPVEVVFAEHSLHAGAAGYGGMLSAWGAGAVAGAAVYARWRRRPQRELIVGGAGSLAVGFALMAAAPTLAVAILGAGLAGVGNGIESVAVRTALQEEVEDQWMALMMSLHEALFQSVPGVGILVGGAVTALWSPRAALALAGAGALAITVVAWFALAGLGIRREPETEAPRAGPRRDGTRTPAVRHQ
jgi:MFS family permease